MRAHSKNSSGIPYATQQGSISAEQGILAREQGILPPLFEPPRDSDNWDAGGKFRPCLIYRIPKAEFP